MCDVISHTLGFPRMGVQRELKKALEAYWAGKASEAELRAVGSELRSRHWAEQDRRGVRLLPAGDFAWYDSTLATSFLLGNIAPRHRDGDEVKLDTLFRAGRGRAPTGQPTSAAEMTKWFNTNYHYMVPEFTSPTQTFTVTWRQLFDEVREAAAVYGAQRVKPVLLGPVSYLHLGKVKSEEKFDRIALLPNLVKAYAAILAELAEIGVEWVQLDEPVLVLDLDESWQAAYEAAYTQLRADAQASPKLLLTTYFDSIGHHLDLIKRLPVDGLHVDFVNGADSLAAVEQALPPQWVLSAGVVSGRNIWKTDLSAWYTALRDISQRRPLWVATSCSLLHCPVDLSCETLLDAELKSWLAFAVQKCDELQLLARALNDGSDAAQAEVAAYSAPVLARQSSERVVRAEVRARVSGLTDADSRRSEPFPERRLKQRERFHLPLWPTTTIGSFPQTASIRTQRQSFRKGLSDEATYHAQLREHIEFAVRQQEALDLDVLVHGEAERTDMVEYFGELLEGFAFTQNGWVQSYGSRCVKPPIIYGDVNRPHAMTVPWSAYAQSLTSRPMKGMLTGPVTILCWSFPREDVTREHIAQQLALALRDEVADLEAAGIHMIQVDEPALREGLPLQRHKWAEYLDWAARAFRIAVSVAQPATQVHTHMCYAEVNDIMSTIVAMDADVISLEASRSDMELLDAFEHSTYPNEIGPGVYDIHSPNIPTVKSIVALLRSAAARVPVDQLWVNPDCGLKTRTWPEVNEALANMVAAAKQLRAEQH